MKIMPIGVTCLLAGAAYAQSFDREFKPLEEARYVIRGKSIIDPGPDEKIDRVAFSITGNAAKEIYESMPAEPELVCFEPIQQKRAGGLACTKTGQDYHCTVAITLDSGETAPGAAC